MRDYHESLTEVLRADIKRAPSGKSASLIAELLGKPYTTLMNELNPEQPGAKFGAELLLPVMELTDSDEPLHYLAKRRGGVFIKLSKAGASMGERQLIRTVKEFGEFASVTGEALEDGRLTQEERRRILKEGYESVEAHMALLKRVEDMEVKS